MKFWWRKRVIIHKSCSNFFNLRFRWERVATKENYSALIWVHYRRPVKTTIPPPPWRGKMTTWHFVLTVWHFTLITVLKTKTKNCRVLSFPKEYSRFMCVYNITLESLCKWKGILVFLCNIFKRRFSSWNSSNHYTFFYLDLKFNFKC